MYGTHFFDLKRKNENVLLFRTFSLFMLTYYFFEILRRCAPQNDSRRGVEEEILRRCAPQNDRRRGVGEVAIPQSALQTGLGQRSPFGRDISSRFSSLWGERRWFDFVRIGYKQSLY